MCAGFRITVSARSIFRRWPAGFPRDAMRDVLKTKFDNLLFSAFTRNWGSARIKAYPQALQSQAKISRSGATEAFQMIDAKAAGMLTHVSMMIAGLGISAPLVAQHPIEEA